MKKTNLSCQSLTEDFKGEIWKLTEFPYYVISNLGRLKRLAHTAIIKREGAEYLQSYPERICRPSVNQHGYLTFQFRRYKKAKLIHRLVAEAFVANPDNLPIINHKDENPSNNKADNLEWCTLKYNANYGSCRERHSKSLTKVRKRLNLNIKQYTLDGDLIATFNGTNEIVNAGFKYSAITACCRHQTQCSQGYVWRYEEDPFSPVSEKENNGSIKKPVVEYDINGAFVRRYESITEASIEKVGTANGTGNISACCLGKKHVAYHSIWRYEGDVPPQPYKRIFAKVLQYTKDMEYIKTYDSITEALKMMGKNPKNREAITLCCSGKAKTAYGYIWRYGDR